MATPIKTRFPKRRVCHEEGLPINFNVDRASDSVGDLKDSNCFILIIVFCCIYVTVAHFIVCIVIFFFFLSNKKKEK